MRYVSLVLAGLFLCSICSVLRAQGEPNGAAGGPLRLVIIGLEHGHVAGFFHNNLERKDIQIVGIADADHALCERYAKQYHLDPKLFHDDASEMLDKTRPQAAVIYTSTFGHLAAVETCAAHGVHAMMEKPLAVSLDAARAMQQAAERGHIHVLVNYETTWYRSNRAAYDMAHDGSIGQVRKIVVHDGHQGPKEIQVQPEFLAWLTDPKLNGAGALFDFGCYGADLATWVLDGSRPRTVTAVTQQIKPDVYPKVDDEATIILTYPKAQVIIQASWNWPYNRKDMEVYGQTGCVLTVGPDEIRVRHGNGPEKQRQASPLAAPYDDPLHFFEAVIRGQVKPDGTPSSLQTNMIVTEILDAARQSAKTGKTIELPAEHAETRPGRGAPAHLPPYVSR